jgi:hypothetical protein
LFILSKLPSHSHTSVVVFFSFSLPFSHTLMHTHSHTLSPSPTLTLSHSPSHSHSLSHTFSLPLAHPQMNSLGRFMRLSRFKKLMLEAVAFSLTPAQITILRAEFNAIDTDRSASQSVSQSFSLTFHFVCCSHGCIFCLFILTFHRFFLHFIIDSSLYLTFLLSFSHFPLLLFSLSSSPFLTFLFSFSHFPLLLFSPYRSGSISLVELQEYVAKVRTHAVLKTRKHTL